MNKQILIPTFTAVVIGSTLFFPSSTKAFWPFDGLLKNGQKSDQAQSRFPFIIQKIIDKFDLNPDEVENVMDEAREEKHEQMQNEFEERLNEAVENGTITEEQKSLILQKHQEMAEKKENWQALTLEERKEQMIQWKTDMKNWLEENGIYMKTLAPMSRGFKTGFFMGRHHK